MSDRTLATAEAFAVPGDVAMRLERYVALLLERNADYNLTGAKDVADALEHVRDSLALVPYVRGPLVDVGSGGGFPAIPLAIVMGIRVTLIESVRKKASFLREVAAALELPVVVRAERAEDAARDELLRGAFSTATARAVGGLTTVLELTVPFLSLGGLAVLQRGGVSAGERTAAADAALVLGAEIEVGDVSHAGVDARTLVLARKVAPTSPRFPRRSGIPAKRPLCRERDG